MNKTSINKKRKKSKVQCNQKTKKLKNNDEFIRDFHIALYLNNPFNSVKEDTIKKYCQEKSVSRTELLKNKKLFFKYMIHEFQLKNKNIIIRDKLNRIGMLCPTIIDMIHNTNVVDICENFLKSKGLFEENKYDKVFMYVQLVFNEIKDPYNCKIFPMHKELLWMPCREDTSKKLMNEENKSVSENSTNTTLINENELIDFDTGIKFLINVDQNKIQGDNYNILDSDSRKNSNTTGDKCSINLDTSKMLKTKKTIYSNKTKNYQKNKKCSSAENVAVIKDFSVPLTPIIVKESYNLVKEIIPAAQLNQLKHIEDVNTNLKENPCSIKSITSDTSSLSLGKPEIIESIEKSTIGNKHENVINSVNNKDFMKKELMTFEDYCSSNVIDEIKICIKNYFGDQPRLEKKNLKNIDKILRNTYDSYIINGFPDWIVVNKCKSIHGNYVEVDAFDLLCANVKTEDINKIESDKNLPTNSVNSIIAEEREIDLNLGMLDCSQEESNIQSENSILNVSVGVKKNSIPPMSTQFGPNINESRLNPISNIRLDISATEVNNDLQYEQALNIKKESLELDFSQNSVVFVPTEIEPPIVIDDSEPNTENILQELYDTSDNQSFLNHHEKLLFLSNKTTPSPIIESFDTNNTQEKKSSTISDDINNRAENVHKQLEIEVIPSVRKTIQNRIIEDLITFSPTNLNERDSQLPIAKSNHIDLLSTENSLFLSSQLKFFIERTVEVEQIKSNQILEKKKNDTTGKDKNEIVKLKKRVNFLHKNNYCNNMQFLNYYKIKQIKYNKKNSLSMINFIVLISNGSRLFEIDGKNVRDIINLNTKQWKSFLKIIKFFNSIDCDLEKKEIENKSLPHRILEMLFTTVPLCNHLLIKFDETSMRRIEEIKKSTVQKESVFLSEALNPYIRNQMEIECLKYRKERKMNHF